MPWHWRSALAFVAVMALLCLLARWVGWNVCVT